MRKTIVAVSFICLIVLAGYFAMAKLGKCQLGCKNTGKQCMNILDCGVIGCVCEKRTEQSLYGICIPQ
jgi:hypothetical protein